MILQPRRFRYKVKQKNRRFLPPKLYKPFTFGSSGLLLLQPLYINGTQIFRLKLFLKRATRRSDNTFRLIWFYAFPHLPLSRKPDGVRMGKGKGKLSAWFTAIPAGIILFEFLNLRHGRSLYFFTQTTHKLGILTKPLFCPHKLIVTPYAPSRKAATSVFY